MAKLLKNGTSKKVTPKKIPSSKIESLKLKGDKIKDRTAPLKVLEASDRRTTNPMERGILYKYLAS